MFSHPAFLSYYAEVRHAEDIRERRTAPRSQHHRFTFSLPLVVKSHYPKQQQTAGLRQGANPL